MHNQHFNVLAGGRRTSQCRPRLVTVKDKSMPWWNSHTVWGCVAHLSAGDHSNIPTWSLFLQTSLPWYLILQKCTKARSRQAAFNCMLLRVSMHRSFQSHMKPWLTLHTAIVSSENVVRLLWKPNKGTWNCAHVTRLEGRQQARATRCAAVTSGLGGLRDQSAPSLSPGLWNMASPTLKLTCYSGTFVITPVFHSSFTYLWIFHLLKHLSTTLP